MTTWRKNEPTAIARQCEVQIFKDDATPAPRGTNFIALGNVYVRGANTPNADTALGTMTNMRRPLTGVALTITVNAATDVVTSAGHGLELGDGPLPLSSTGTRPGGLDTAPFAFYAIPIDANTFKLATTLANAYAGAAIDITSTGSGTLTLASDASSTRGMDGRFVYQATQAETDHNAAEMAIIVDDGGTGNYALKNSAGGSAYVTMTSGAGVWDTVLGADGRTAGDMQRHNYRANGAGKLLRAGTAYTLRNETDTKDAAHGTITDAGGRTLAVIDDPTI